MTASRINPSLPGSIPPLYCDYVRCLQLQEYPPPPRIYPLNFQQIYSCDSPRIYPSLPEYTPFFNNSTIFDPPRIYPSLSEYNSPFSTTKILCALPKIYPSLKEYFSVLRASGRFSHIDM